MNPLPPSDEAARRRRSRSIFLAVALALFVVLLYAITIVRIGGQ